jgi:hypothetical protein
MTDITTSHLDPSTLSELRALEQMTQRWREPLTCEGRTMHRGMDGYFVQIEGDPIVYLHRDLYSALLQLIDKEA